MTVNILKFLNKQNAFYLDAIRVKYYFVIPKSRVFDFGLKHF